MMGWYGRGMGPFVWLAMGVFWLIVLGLIAWLVVRLLSGSSTGTTRPMGESPLEILDRRLASGEVDLPTWQAQRAAILGVQRRREGPRRDVTFGLTLWWHPGRPCRSRSTKSSEVDVGVPLRMQRKGASSRLGAADPCKEGRRPVVSRATFN